MHKLLLFSFLVLLLSYSEILLAQPDAQVKFDAPATHFTQALPLGNGRLGAMVFGGVNQERIVLNEISMWSGGVEDPNRRNAHQYLPQIQQLLKEEKNKEAQELLQKHFTSAGKGSGWGAGANEKFGCYQILSDLFIRWHDTTKPVTGYNRILQLDKALATTTWRRGNVTLKEEVLVSAPQQVIVIRLSSSEKEALSFDLLLDRKEAARFTSSGDALTMTGQLNGGDSDKGIRFAAYLKVIPIDGKIENRGPGVRVKRSSQCMIIISAATDLNWPAVEKRGPSPLPIAQKLVTNAGALSWNTLLNSHLKDYQSYFERCRLNFFAEGNNEKTDLTTAERLIRYAAGERDVHLPALYFNFGRYLLISSSRPGNLPANLQGLWAEEYQTPWNGDYHLNINLQMNYWPAEITNLADCHLPLLQFTKQLVSPGEITAKAYYNTRGWTAHMMSNPWKFTAPGESATWGSSLTGGAWLCQHLWQHYSYNPDRRYLQSIYPVLKGAAQFYIGILVNDPKTGWLVTAPSNSPENTYITEDGFRGQTTMGPAMDMQIGRELLHNTIKAASILGIDYSFSDSLQHISRQLAPNQISQSTGGIQEWIRDYKEAEPQHRHVSHLFGLYPFDEINDLETPELMTAARKTLERRGDGGTGWSRAWKIAFWARLGDGNHALTMLKSLLQPAFILNPKYEGRGAGTYPNLFCAHPPFQIDGNLGATTAIAEMLLQTTGKNKQIRILPALPASPEWQNGSIKGLCAPGGFEISFTWEKGFLQRGTILSKAGEECRIQLPEGINVYDAKGKRKRVTVSGNNMITFQTQKGTKYILKRKESFTKGYTR